MAQLLETGGEQSRLFVQEGPCKPWVFLGCATVAGLGTTGQVEYDRCVGPHGVEISTISRRPNPREATLTFGENYLKLAGLVDQYRRNACKPNFLLASAYCKDSDRIDDPGYGDVFTLIEGADILNHDIGNNTAAVRDPNNSGRREDQISITQPKTLTFGSRKWQLLVEDLPDEIQTMAVVDDGKCGDVICNPCDIDGGDIIFAGGAAAWYVTTRANQGSGADLDPVTPFASEPVSGTKHAHSFNRTLVAVRAAKISVSSNNGVSWTEVTSDVSFSALSNIVKIDNRTYIIGGHQGAVWQSSTLGTWITRRPANVASPDILRLGYNPTTKRLIAITKDADDGFVIRVSSNLGRTWTDATPAPIDGLTYDADTSNYLLHLTDTGCDFIVLNGRLYKLTCARRQAGCAVSSPSIEEVVCAEISGKITGIGSVDENPNSVVLTVANEDETGSIYQTYDGFASCPQIACLEFALEAVSPVMNAFAASLTKYGSKLVVAIGDNIYEGHDWDSFFLAE